MPQPAEPEAVRAVSERLKTSLAPQVKLGALPPSYIAAAVTHTLVSLTKGETLNPRTFASTSCPHPGVPKRAKSWPGAFWKQFSAICRPLGRQLKCPSGTIGKRPFWAKSWPGAFWKQLSAISGPLGRLLNLPSGIIGKGPFLAKSWPGAFWKQFSAICRPLGQQLQCLSGTIGKRPFWAKSWPGAFWKQLSAICGPLGQKLHSFSGTTGKRPFWVKLLLAAATGGISALCNARESCPGRGAATYPDVSPSFKRIRRPTVSAILLWLQRTE